jgi:hypothetical protein
MTQTIMRKDKDASDDTDTDDDDDDDKTKDPIICLQQWTMNNFMSLP